MLLTADKNYGDDVDYDLFPKTGDDVGRFGDGYNSNSFISGILEFLDINLPEMKSNVPGADKPLPDSYFISDSWMPSPAEEGEW